MKLVVGLGNPGKTYAGTRHNIGFMVVDRLAGEGEWTESKKGQLEYIWFDVQGENIELIKPLTMMNNSGKAVAYAKRKHPALRLDDLYIVHDDLDIPLGKYKIQLGKGPRVHGGLRSIYRELGSEEFWHVRLGIENRFREIRSTKHEIRNGSTSLTISSSLSLEPNGLSLSKDTVQISNAQKHLKQTSKAMISGEEYVLQHFAGEEQAVIKRVIEKVALELVGKLGEE